MLDVTLWRPEIEEILHLKPFPIIYSPTMAEIVSNIIQNSLSGFVSGAVTTAGGYAGSAVNGVGGLIEGAGHSVGNGSNSYTLMS
jgi:hypothetical protein